MNAWGLVAGPTTPWWVADADADVSTLYGCDGTPRSLVVSVAGGPTGLVFNGTSRFVVTDGMSSGPALFIWATESGCGPVSFRGEGKQRRLSRSARL